VRPVGGFFELEVARARSPYHRGALGLTSGRACLKVILQALRPTKVYVPFYVCDAVLQPIRMLGIDFEFYGITPELNPDIAVSPRKGECLIYVDYFGLKTRTLRSLRAGLDATVVADDTQAFFTRPGDGEWSFNSARKFFGVPDGGYLYGPVVMDLGALQPNQEVAYDHLISRLLCRQELAYAQYRASEAQVSVETKLMSRLSERLLASVDYDFVIDRRRRNFRLLHERLGAANTLAMDLGELGEHVPFCYPFLPAVALERTKLHRRSIFVPALWNEVRERHAAGFTLERGLSEKLLPLPVDHRWDEEDVTTVARAVREALP
jgi:hypothetical protein